MPNLRRNRRTETRWGAKYYTAVKNAVFITETQPYEPTLPSFPLEEYVPECENLYMCTQCKDCFYFRSSLEDHIARKSWILGYWCHHCFVTACKHSSVKGIKCSACLQLDHEKRSYLRSRGLRNNQKFGAIRIFYNQCQFFAHLKAHNVDLVNIGDLMLMPLPTNIIDWNPEVDLICEALMEHTFIIKVHIMDWLRNKTVDNNWWQLTEDANNPVTIILKGYNGRFHFKPLEISIEEQISILNSAHSTPNNAKKFSDINIPESVESVDKGTSPSSTDTRVSISDESMIENEDSPCTVNDITFVNCGFSKFLESEFPDNNIKRKGNTIVSVKSVQDSCTPKCPNVINKFKGNKVRHLNSISSNMVMSCGNTMIASKRDIKDLSNHPTNKQLCKSLTHKSSNNLSVKTVTEGNIVKEKSDRKENKTLCNNLLKIAPVSKVQSDVSCTAKVDTYKNKLGHASDNAPGDNNEESSSEGVIHLVPVGNEKLSKMKINVGNENLSQAGKETNRNSSKNQTEPFKNKLRPFPGRVIYQNGRKYIIKQSSGLTKNLKTPSNAVVPVKNVQGTVQSKSTNIPPLVFYNIPPLIPLDSTEIENISNQEETNSFHNDVSPLTPSPSPSELSNSSSCDIQSKQTSLSAKGSQKVDVPYLNTEHKDIGIDVQNMNNSFESLTFHKGEDQNLYLDVKFLNQKPIYSIVDTSTMITKCREEMLNEFFHLSYFELKKRYDHLQEIGEEISRVMNFLTDNVIKENLKAVHILQTVLKHCIDKCIEKSDDTEEKDALLHEWESEYEKTDEKPVCKACNKIKKPKYYIPGFSKPAKNDIYCSCYKHMCHKCHTYQGNSTRFVAHQTFHDKERPYLCPDCYRKFTSYRSLEVHTWTTCFHTLKRRVLGCKICEIDGFQDMESVAKHFAIMHSHNKVVCDKCYIVLPSYSEYRKHHKDKHSDANDHQPIRLVLCKLGRCIVRCEDYMLHMEKHIVVQRLIWFKCPFCTFIHVEAKRIMSHLQSEHETRLEELTSSETLWNTSQVETAANLLKNSLQQNKFTNAHTESCEDGTVMPKIVNTRTITSEVFEHGAQGTDDNIINYETPLCSKVVDVNSESSPKLSGIIPKILDVRSMADLTSDISECDKIEATSKFIDTTTSKIINAGNITSEVFEREAQRTDDNTINKETEQNKAHQGQEIKTELEHVIDCVWDTKTIQLSPGPIKVESPQQDHLLEVKNDQSTYDTSCDKAKIQLDETKQEARDVSNNTQRQKQSEAITHELILKPPPLVRIPQHVLELNRSKKAGQIAKGGKMAVFSRDQEVNRYFPRRIALTNPTNSNEILNFPCPLCRELINTSKSVISNHFQGKHLQDCKLSAVAINLLRMSPEFINGGYKELLDNKKRKSESTISSSKRRRRWNPKKYNTDGKNVNFTGLGLCVTQETAEDSEGNFRCKKCDQRCSNMTNLREHIACNHRIKGRYLVCLECGDNFVVVPSLQMHLKAFHGIEDPITYMAQNTSYAPDNVDDLEAEGKSIEANQCHVCMAVFEDKAAVDKHLRVHGMAFLNRKRIEAQNALKSPEKKSEMEEEKCTPIKASPKELVRKDKPAETILEKITATI